MSSPTKNVNKPNFICIHCGFPVEELYRKYSPSVLKIMNCGNCGEIADKYIEFEPTIVVIDLILLSRPAYKHLLFNTKFKNYWKLLLVILLLDAYILYKTKAHPDAVNDANFTLEKIFYFCLASILIENVILFILLRLSLLFTRSEENLNIHHNERAFQLSLIKAMTIAHVAKFFQLPILIWNKNTNELATNLNHTLVIGYIILALTHVYSVMSNRGRCFSALIIVCVLLSTLIFSSTINTQIIFTNYI